jgi:hypothetical protein
MEKKQEITLIENTLKLLRRGKYELTGEEAIVFHSCFQYLVKRIAELNQPEITQIVTKESRIKNVNK